MLRQRTQLSTQSKLRRLFIVIGVPLGSMCLTFVILYIFFPRQSPPVVVNSTLIIHTKTTSTITVPIAGPPVRLQIVPIGIDTVINPVGLTNNGAMDISENPDQVAWYKLGAIPGQVGSAVIAGHYGWQQDGHGAIFNNLNKLKPGDTVAVYDASGIETDFTVRATRLYDPSADASEVFDANNGKVQLNLITCQGTWVNATDSYSERLVVFTELKQK
ncbi:class F sortase [Patescibacteria group bacterium]|nr:MAG: class F sortase [Patescibacteria group bacterium]